MTVKKACVRLLFRVIGLVLILTLSVICLPLVWDKLSPFIIAIPIAAMLQPIVSLLEKKLKMKRSTAVLIPVLLIFLVLLGLVYFALSFGIGQLMEFLNDSPTLINDTIQSVRNAVEKVLSAATHLSGDTEGLVRSALNNSLTSLKGWGTMLVSQTLGLTVNVVTGLPYAFIYANFLVIGLYFITRNYAEIRSWLPGGTRMNQESHATRLTHSAIRSLLGYLRVQGTYSLVTLVVSWIFFVIFGFRYALLLALLAMILEFIPLFGNGVLYIPYTVIAYIQGNVSGGTEILVLFLLLQVIRRVTEPKLMSSSIGISPLQSLIGMFVGLRFGGVIGLIGGPVIMAVAVGLVKGPSFTALMEDIHVVTGALKNIWKKE